MKYNIEITRPTGSKEVFKKEPNVPLAALLQALKKGEIKGFYVESN